MFCMLILCTLSYNLITVATSGLLSDISINPAVHSDVTQLVLQAYQGVIEAKKLKPLNTGEEYQMDTEKFFRLLENIELSCYETLKFVAVSTSARLCRDGNVHFTPAKCRCDSVQNIAQNCFIQNVKSR